MRFKFEFRIEFSVLASCRHLIDALFVRSEFSFTSRFFSNVLFRCDWFFIFFSVLFVLSGAFCDWSANSVPYFTFNSSCSERMLITYCSSYTSSFVAFSTGFMLIKSVNFKLLPVTCWIAISKCASRSNHLVSLALYCLLHRFLLIKGSRAWWSVYKKTFFP